MLKQKFSIVFIAFGIWLSLSGCSEEKSKAEQVRDALRAVGKVPEQTRKMDSTINANAQKVVEFAKELEESAPSKQKASPSDSSKTVSDR